MPSVRDAMSDSIVSVPPSASVAEAATVMGSHAVGSVLVLHGERLVGIFTERDIVRALSEHFDAAGHLVQNWMTDEPVTVAADAAVEDALDLMLSKGFRHLPVLDGGTLLGVVSLRDLGRYTSSDHPT
ncbi:MAG: CBS domain-containing protein [Actinomycetota bacterium]